MPTYRAAARATFSGYIVFEAEDMERAQYIADNIGEHYGEDFMSTAEMVDWGAEGKPEEVK